MRHEALDFGLAARARERRARRFVDGPKRLFDLAGVIVFAPVALPLIGLLWALARRDGAPGFFAHERIGRDGTPFRCWKIRSMVPNSQAVLRAHLRADRAAAREWAAHYKLRSDPRITRLGRFLRQTSLDELPQLWNVWRGEMSLVGPRPVVADELCEYGNATWVYLLVRPGITGLWQVSGRNRTSYRERVLCDTRYVMRLSLRQDIVILWRTIGEVARRGGL